MSLDNRMEEILIERAKVLSLPLETAKARSKAPLFLHFSDGFQEYAVAACEVRAIIRATELLPVPGAPPVFRGIASYQGEIIDVIDLRILTRAGEGSTRPSFIVVLGGASSSLLGLVADQVSELREIPESELVAFSAGAGMPGYVRGTSLSSVVIIDAPALLDDSSFFGTPGK